MARFTAIDLSQMSPPDVIQTLDYEGILSALKDDFLARFPDYDVSTLESDPVVKVLEVAAYRELLLRARVNDAARAVLLATAKGSDLDHLGALYSTSRLNDETDDAYRSRIQLAPEAFSSCGPAGAYRYYALKAGEPEKIVKDVNIVQSEPGRITVFVMSTVGSGSADAGLVAKVRETLDQESRLPLTDSITVNSVTVVSYDIEVVIEIPYGPDAETVRQEAITSIQAYAASRHFVGKSVMVNGLIEAAFVKVAENVELIAPEENIVVQPGEVAYAASLTVTTRII